MLTEEKFTGAVERYMGSRGEVPCPGFGDEIPKMIIREASIPKNRREAEGDNSDSETDCL